MTTPYEAPEDVAPSEHLDPDERDIEAPEADAVEQATPATPVDANEPLVFNRSLEVNEYDALEQAQVVDLDEDYR
jgi:hypothetical protein